MPHWMSPSPARCDLCQAQITSKFVDGAVPRAGSAWACVCPSCFSKEGMSLGTGRGQEYTKQADGRFLKTGG